MDDAPLSGLADAPLGPGLAKAPTGIAGLDAITGGGLPRDRVTLVAGGAGTGKTLLGLQFLAAGAQQYGEPGVLMTFEEAEPKLAANACSLGLDLGRMKRDGLLAVLSFRDGLIDLITTGEFSLEPLFLMLEDAIRRIGAARVALDSIDVLFGAFGDDIIVRAELLRLARWLEERGVTTILTGERGAHGLTRLGIEEYVSDCVIALDHRVREEISTRRLRVVKYRGSAHGTNEYPFLISSGGFSVLPITSVTLDYQASAERIPTGVDRLDHMLGGGLFRGSTVLVSGMAGTGKTSIAAHVVDAACRRGETALWTLYEESPAQVVRNMRSIGIDLQVWLDAGLLRMWAARPSAMGPETHLAMLARLIETVAPSVAVLDGIAGLTQVGTTAEVTATVGRQVDLLKSRGVTTLATILGHSPEATTLNVSSLVDTWLMVRNVETNGERNRLLYVLKSRGSDHSNQVREFLITSHGIDLIDVYVGPGGCSPAPPGWPAAAERDAQAREADDLGRRKRELRRSIADGEAQLAAAQKQLSALREQVTEERAEIDRLDDRARHRTVNAETDRLAMAAQRWADVASSDGGPHEPA